VLLNVLFNYLREEILILLL